MRSQQSLATFLLFAGLFGLAGAVFFILPEKVAEEKRQAAASSPVEVSVSDEASTPAPSPDALESEERAPASPISKSPAPAPAPSVTFSPEELPEDRAFKAAMSTGLHSLGERQWDAAEEAFEDALSARPEAPEALDGLARAQTGLRTEAIARFTAEAEEATEKEQWAEATVKWSMVLAIDPGVEKALRGRHHAAELATLEERLQFHLQNPERLSAGAVLAEAESLLGKAGSLSVGARIKAHAEELAGVVEQWSQPIPIRLRSDGATEVNLYRIGSLGAFEEHALELRPGTYTLVGRRDGFRDVREKLVVAPGGSPEPLTIRCTEKI